MRVAMTRTMHACGDDPPPCMRSHTECRHMRSVEGTVDGGDKGIALSKGSIVRLLWSCDLERAVRKQEGMLFQYVGYQVSRERLRGAAMHASVMWHSPSAQTVHEGPVSVRHVCAEGQLWQCARRGGACVLRTSLLSFLRCATVHWWCRPAPRGHYGLRARWPRAGLRLVHWCATRAADSHALVAEHACCSCPAFHDAGTARCLCARNATRAFFDRAFPSSATDAAAGSRVHCFALFRAAPCSNSHEVHAASPASHVARADLSR
jgi:hypothetical protein